MAKKKIDDIEEIGKNLPQSKATEEFIEKVEASTEKGKQSKDASKKKTSKTKSGPTPLTDLSGVGDSLAKRIIDGGFKSVEELTELEPEDLTDIKGIGSPAKATSLIEAARKMVGTKKKGKKEPEPPKIRKAPPLNVRVEIPEGTILYLMPSDIDNTQHQPRDKIEGEIFLSPEFVENIRRHKGNIQAILARKPTEFEESTQRVKAVTIDGHRRAEAIRKINKLVSPKNQLKVKVELIDVTKPEADIIALDSNLDAERLNESQRDRWIYYMMEDGVTDDQLSKTTGMNKTTLSNIRRVFEKSPKQVLELLDKGEVTTGHLKALASLPPRDQKRLAKKAAKHDISVRDIEGEAKQARAKESVISKIEDHVRSKYKLLIAEKEELEVPSISNFYTEILNAAYPKGAESALKHTGHWPSDTDVKSAIRRAKLKVVEKPVDEPLPPKKSLCESCVANVDRYNLCLWTQSDPEIKPPMFDKCPKYLAGPATSDWTLNTCPHCLTPVWKPKSSTAPYYTIEEAVTVSDSLHSFNDSIVPEDHTVKAHTWCVIQHLIEELNITGSCEDCNNADCEFMQGISKMPRTAKPFAGTFNITKCKAQKKGFVLKAFNKATVDAWLDAMKAQEPDPELVEEPKEETPELVEETETKA